VLVIDDDAGVRQAIQWALEDEGLEVVAAAGGGEALALAAERQPEVVVLDLTLPGINGYELASGLRAGQSRRLAILLITADGQAPAKAQEVGAYAYLRKPFELGELIRAVRAGFSRR
jgi:two-component system KDP operon response regulator KdpE